MTAHRVAPRGVDPRDSTPQKPIIDVAKIVTKKVPKPILPLWFLNDAYEAAKKKAIAEATVRASQAGAIADRAFTSAMYREATPQEIATVKRKAEQMAVDGAPMAEITKYVTDQFQNAPEAVSLRMGVQTYQNLTNGLLERGAQPQEVAAIRGTVRDLFNQGKTPAEITTFLDQSIRNGPEYRKLHAEETVTAQYQAVLQRAPNPQEIEAGVASVGGLIDQGRSPDEVNAALAASLKGTLEWNERFGVMPQLTANGQQVEAERGGSGKCAGAVEEAIERTMGIQVWGDAKDLAQNLPGTGRFQQVNMSLEEALKHPGLVLVWQKSGASEAGMTYGHTAITTGDGHSSTSDYFENDTLATGSYRYDLTVWMPVA
ncbi:MAG: hypothetical protein IPJ65_35135 [Archangiaceae bacterium]|nr:hypothetical protein [Archangiaceae bacterium]